MKKKPIKVKREELQQIEDHIYNLLKKYAKRYPGLCDALHIHCCELIDSHENEVYFLLRKGIYTVSIANRIIYMATFSFAEYMYNTNIEDKISINYIDGLLLIRKNIYRQLPFSMSFHKDGESDVTDYFVEAINRILDVIDEVAEKNHSIIKDIPIIAADLLVHSMYELFHNSKEIGSRTFGVKGYENEFFYKLERYSYLINLSKYDFVRLIHNRKSIYNYIYSTILSDEYEDDDAFHEALVGIIYEDMLRGDYVELSYENIITNLKTDKLNIPKEIKLAFTRQNWRSNKDIYGLVYSYFHSRPSLYL